MSRLIRCCQYSGLLLACALSAAVFLLAFQNGLITDFGDSDPNLCTMTYMYPSYTQIPMQNASRHAEKYELYHYQDANLIRLPRNPLEILIGVPVLFIPGNAGSYRQVRSIGTTSIRAYKNGNNVVHRTLTKEQRMKEKEIFKTNRIDFFTLNFHEELSALNGDMLYDQREFLTDSITKILSLYNHENIKGRKPENKPSSVILLGHSMGGLVARSVFLSPTYKNGTVRTIITLNTPHLHAPVLLHERVFDFYDEVNRLWSQSCIQNPELRQTALVSIGGGWRDSQVHASLSNLEKVISCPQNQITAVSTSIPDVWISMDHQSCMWCNQLMVILNSAISGLVDPSTGQATQSLMKRLETLQSYLLSNLPSALKIDPSASYTNKPPGRQKIPKHKVPAWIDTFDLAKQTSNHPLLRISGADNLSKRKTKIHIPPSDNARMLQIYTTVPLEDMQVGICSETSCVDLTPSFAPIPYNIREVKPREFRTLKAHVQLVSLEEYTSYTTMFLEIEANRVENSPNFAVYKGDYGDELFFMAEVVLDGPTEDIVPKALESASIHIPPSVVSRFSLPSASKYLPVKADVAEISCQEKPIVAPLIMAFATGLKEERFGLHSLPLRFHEQTFPENDTSDHVASDKNQDTKSRSHKKHQTPLQVVIFSDPVCSYELRLSPDWPATFDVILRNHGVLIIGLTLWLGMMVAGELQNGSSSSSSTALQALSSLIISPWMIVMPGLYLLSLYVIRTYGHTIPEAILSQHSFTTLARPWPQWEVHAILVPFAFTILGVWLLLCKIVGLVVCFAFNRRSPPAVPVTSAPNPIVAISPSSPTEADGKLAENSSQAEKSEIPPLADRNYSGGAEEVSTTSSLFTRISISVVTLALLSSVALWLHAGISVILSLLLLKLPLRSAQGLLGNRTGRLDRRRDALFVMYSPMLLVLVPELVVWVRDLVVVWRPGGCYEALGVVLALHVVILRFVGNSEGGESNGSKLKEWRRRLVNVLASFAILSWALFPVFRSSIVLSSVSVLDIMDTIL